MKKFVAKSARNARKKAGRHLSIIITSPGSGGFVLKENLRRKGLNKHPSPQDDKDLAKAQTLAPENLEEAILRAVGESPAGLGFQEVLERLKRLGKKKVESGIWHLVVNGRLWYTTNQRLKLEP